MADRRPPAWIPYKSPPVTLADRVNDWMRAYGFYAVLGGSILVFLGLVFGLPNFSGQDNNGYLSEAQLQTPAAGTLPTSRTDNTIARLHLFAEPRGTTVQVDEGDIYRTPLLNQQLAPGSYQLRFQRDGYATLDTMIYLAGGNSSLVTVSLQQSAQPVARPASREPIRRFPVQSDDFERARIEQRERVQQMVSNLPIPDTLQISDRDRAIRDRIGW